MKRQHGQQGESDVRRLQTLITLVLVIVGLASALWGVRRSGDINGFALNVGTELLGAAVTYWLLTRIIGGAEKREEEEVRKALLIRQMGSDVLDVAVLAVEELRTAGWLYDGSLKGARLGEANLQGAQLPGANLQGADLIGANLQGASLSRANLQGARLGGADLQGAFLVEADLQGADLGLADLQGASLCGADLREADLGGANLEGTLLEHPGSGKALLNGKTTLPDITSWLPGTDMARFTDPEHPEFWRSEKSWSPAYRGEDYDKDDD